jgi:regulator of sirC expression with transglutaminase-like and TPR domain
MEHAGSPRQGFQAEVTQPADRINLTRAALYIAQEEYPTLDPAVYLAQLNIWAQELRDRLPPDPYPLRVIQTINQYLYEDLGFQGNTEDYYDPRNSYLNDVLSRRTGIPITLSVVYLHLAQRLDFPMVGIGMPGHFLIRPMVNEMEVFVDPFHGGEILFQQDCQARLEHLYGRPVPWQPAFVAAVDHHRILARMLTNLKYIHLHHNQWLKALADIERIMLLYPDALHETRDRGLVCYQLGRWQEARQDLAVYLDAAPLAQDADMVRQLLQRIASP